MSTTTTQKRIDMVRGSTSYEDKFGKPPRHRSDEVGDMYKVGIVEPKHRKADSKPRHRLWDIEQH